MIDYWKYNKKKNSETERKESRVKDTIDCQLRGQHMLH